MLSSSAAYAENPTGVVTNDTGDLIDHDGNIISHVYSMSPDEAKEIYRWLAAPNSSIDYLAAREKHHEETGTWFIEGKQFIHWKETPDSALWVNGIPGCGKTVICSTVIEDILRHCESKPTFACAYFFFDNRSAQNDLSLHGKLIRSIIQQFCNQSNGVPAPLVQSYGQGHQQPSIDSLQTTLQRIIEGFERTYIVIDALDECTDREKVLSWIEQLVQSRAGKLRVMVSSRSEDDIKRRFDSIPTLVHVCLEGRAVKSDIESYLDSRLSRMIRWDEPTVELVRDVIIGADGMFRWVALQVGELSKCRSRKAVEAQLQTIPKDLDGVYEKLLLNHPNARDLKRFLLWLAFSTRPLKAVELTEVVTVDFSSKDMPSYDPDIRYFGTIDMLAMCSSFATEFKGTVKLAHMSVKEYLVSDRLRHGAASYFSLNDKLSHTVIIQTCLAYLLHLGKLSVIDESTIEKFPLALYAAKHWMAHMRKELDEESYVWQMVAQLFSPDSNASVNWIRLEDPDAQLHEDNHSNHTKASADVAPLLYYACSSGLEEMVEQLLTRGADVQGKGGLYGCALQAASFYGHDAVVQLLLDRGADVNAQGGAYDNALQVASYHGHDAVVQLLLTRGAGVNTVGGKYGSALQAALYRSHSAIVQLLLDHGADVNVQGGMYGSALQAASYYGHDAVVQLLLDHGADVNAQGGAYGNALQVASYHGHDAVVQLLLDHGAGVNAIGGKYGSALQAALYRKHSAIVQLLLDRGADVNAQGGKYGSALQAASYHGHSAVVQLLLDHGADVNAHGGVYGSNLQVASKEGHYAIVQLLLDHGAAVNAQGGWYGNALQTASCKGHDTLVRLLLAHGADVNAQGGTWRTALIGASAQGHIEAVRLLLTNGADLKAQGAYTLQWARACKRDDIVRLLIDSGVSQKRKKRTEGETLAKKPKSG